MVMAPHEQQEEQELSPCIVHDNKKSMNAEEVVDSEMSLETENAQLRQQLAATEEKLRFILSQQEANGNAP